MNDEIKTKYADWIKAGKIASEVREYSKTIIKPGAKLLGIGEKIENKIRELGATPAFPINLSSDNFAAHYTPTPEDETILDKQLLKVDVGVCFNGAVGDTAYTFDLSGKHDKLVEASKKAVENAIKIIKPGVMLCEIGKVIEDTITSYGFQPIRNLSGHGLDLYEIHTSPSIPNYDNNDTTQLEKGMIIAIEPFATDGAGRIKEGSHANIFMQEQDKPIRDMFARKIFEEIKKFNGLPFSTRDLVKLFPLNRVKLALRQLLLNNNIQQYAPLPEVNDGMVSQHEHTILVWDEGIVLTK
ncbi:type II methionyl aminopeptidase [Candidatus Woesearchaeota archaeon]|jgi:methionyl aminopeptidase|nr:type II methionyl aminopeptidase [Candidatus Woesearchaeota archaeon]